MKCKNFLILLIFSLTIHSICFGQKDSTHFVTTWKTDNPGLSNDSAIYLEIDSSFTYNFDVDWNNDGVFDTLNVSDNLLIQYPSPGTYTIRIRGIFPAIYFVPYRFMPNVTPRDQNKMVSIDQWGTNSWQSLYQAFMDCQNVICSATDAPDLTNITSLGSMFSGATSFNGDLSTWNVSTITDMSFLFEAANNFNGNVSNWNVSNVTNMGGMFAGARSFNQDLSYWIVSSVSIMEFMFYDAISFNKDISGWDVTSASEMNNMFDGANSFNQDISRWDISNATTIAQMFYSNSIFDQDLSNWNIQNTSNLYQMFDNSALSRINYDKILKVWEAKPHPSNLSFGGRGLKYCTSDSARALLIADGWSFNGDSLDCQLVGINKSRITPTYKIYPNPAREQVKIETDHNFKVIQIYNSSGQKVLEANTKTINIEALQRGIYYLQVLFGDTKMSSIFIKE